MLGFLYRIFIGSFYVPKEPDPCAHEWVIHDEITVYSYHNDKYPTHTKYVLRCKKCGDMKNHKTIK